MRLEKLQAMLVHLQNGTFIGQEYEELAAMVDRGELSRETFEAAQAAGQIDFDHEIWGVTQEDKDDIDNDKIVEESLSMTIEMVDEKYLRTDYEYFSPLINSMENWSGWFKLTPYKDGAFIIDGYVAEYNPQTHQKNLLKVSGVKYYPKNGRTYWPTPKVKQWGRWEDEMVKPSSWLLRETEQWQEFYRSSKVLEDHKYRNSGQVSQEFWAVLRDGIIEWRKSWKTR